MIGRVLITGANGFLGKSFQLQYKAAITLGQSTQNDIKCDLSKDVPHITSCCEVIIHAAGKAHSSPKTNRESQSFFDSNVSGTANLLKGLEKLTSMPKSFVYISSVAVYGLKSGNHIDEAHPLNATDAYGLSKIHAERLVQDWCIKNEIICAILRLPLIVGENPPGNLGSMIRGIKNCYYFNIGGGNAKRSMVLADDVVTVISKVSEVGGVFNLTDGYHPTFAELSTHIASQTNKKKVLNISLRFAMILALLGDFISWFPINSKVLSKLTSNLIFDDTKARTLLDWNPQSVLCNFKIN